MPELPEVETIRRGLTRRILGDPITRVEVRLPKVVRSSLDVFFRELEGAKVESIDRQGKLLIFRLAGSTQQSMLLHLKMTGQLIYRHGNDQVAGGHPWPSYSQDLPNQYTHIIFSFASGSHLFFNDQRQFGFVRVAHSEEVKQERAKYGIEPLTRSFTRAKFFALLANRRTSVKSILLNQKLISGIGNIYADEICFYAGVRPERPANSLTTLETHLLFDACLVILETAIQQRGTTISDYTDSTGKRGNYSDFLKVYARTGQSCLRCSGTITKTKVAGRGTHFCDNCQV